MCYDTREASSRRNNLYISSFLCSTGTAALRHHTAFSVSTPSPLRLFRYFPILSESVLLPPTSNTFLRIHLTKAMDSTFNQSTYTCRDSNLLGPWHKPLHIPNMASGNLCHLPWHEPLHIPNMASSNLCHLPWHEPLHIPNLAKQ